MPPRDSQSPISTTRPVVAGQVAQEALGPVDVSGHGVLAEARPAKVALELKERLSQLRLRPVRHRSEHA